MLSKNWCYKFRNAFPGAFLQLFRIKYCLFQQRGLGEHCSSPSRVRGGAPEAKAYSDFTSLKFFKIFKIGLRYSVICQGTSTKREQTWAKGPFRFSSQTATCYYQAIHSQVEAIPLSALPKDTSELAGLSSHYPSFMLNVKQGSCEYQLLKSFGLTRPESRTQVYRLLTQK